MKYEYQELSQSSIQIIDGDRGKNYPNGNDFSSRGYCLFLNAKNVTADGFSFSERSFISKEKDGLLRKGKLMRRDTVLTTRGTVGNVAFFSDNIPYPHIRINSGMVIIRPNPEVFDPEFTYWLFRSSIVQNQIVQLRSGTAQPQLPISSMQRIRIPVPKMDVQKVISGIVGSLQRKIELNQRINDNLQQQAQALYKAWFVDEIEVNSSLSDICQYSKEKIAVSSLDLDNYYSTENMLPGKAGANQATSLPTSAQTTGCRAGDILVSNIRPYFKKIVYCSSNCGCSTDVLCFVPKQKVFSSYLYFTLYLDSFFDYMVAGSKGTKMPRGDKQQIMKYPIYIPTGEEMMDFNSIAQPILNKVRSNQEENKRLIELRDTLLPKLMAGEIDVRSVSI